MHRYLDTSNSRMVIPMKKRNVRRFEPLNPGDRVIVTDAASVPTIKWAKGRVVSVQDNARSPYKNLVTIWLEGSAQYGNPWHVFRAELDKMEDENGLR